MNRCIKEEKEYRQPMRTYSSRAGSNVLITWNNQRLNVSRDLNELLARTCVDMDMGPGWVNMNLQHVDLS